MTHTLQGKALLQRFVYDICGCSAMDDAGLRDEAVARIREQVGDDEVILGLSGGVDSSVAAALIHKAIGKQLTCVFVDHGLMRLNEGQQVMETFAKHMHVKVIHVDVAEEFYGALADIRDPSRNAKSSGSTSSKCFSANRRRSPRRNGSRRHDLRTSSSPQGPRPRSQEHQVHTT